VEDIVYCYHFLNGDLAELGDASIAKFSQPSGIDYTACLSTEGTGSGDTGQGGDNSNADGNNKGSSFSGPTDDVAECEHRTRTRATLADCSDFRDNPVDCSMCGEVALNGTPLQQAIVCTNCGATICENCNAPNSDSDNDSGIG
jgi:hypothetical protein